MLSVWEERKVRLYGEHANVHQSHSQNDSGDLRGVAGGDGKLGGVRVVRQAPVICVMAPPIHLGAWSMALMSFRLVIIYAGGSESGEGPREVVETNQWLEREGEGEGERGGRGEEEGNRWWGRSS